MTNQDKSSAEEHTSELKNRSMSSFFLLERGNHTNNQRVHPHLHLPAIVIPKREGHDLRRAA